MNITSAKYHTGDLGIEAVIDGITMCVPVEPTNRHYQLILEWVDNGNSISEAES
jgi:hypothetical protein